MLKLPAFKQYQFPTGETATVFQDDAQFWRFYAIPGFPTVRLTPDGDPVFQLIKYAFSDAAREEDPELPRGGGYMVFDSELKVSAEHRDHIIADLQSWVDAEWERMKHMPNDKLRTLELGATFVDTIGEHWGQEGMRGTRRASASRGSTTFLTMPGSGFEPPTTGAPAPQVVIGEPLWISGNVTMSAPQSTGLVQHATTERPASLIGNNVAAFNMDLTPDGATFMQKTLVGEDGGGATDLSPIQVVYQIKMLAKLPPATMYVKFNTASIYHSVQELFHEHHNCTDDYFTSENLMSTAIEAGLITVKIDMGGVQDDDLEQMMMQQAMNMVQQLLTDRFAEKEREPMEEWADSDLAESSNEVYRLKQVTEVDMTNFEHTMEINTTTEFEIAPQGTLAVFFHGRTDMDKFVRQILLGDAFFNTLGLKARAFANWEEDEIAFVEIEIKYSHGGQIKTQTFTFTATDNDPKEWDPSVIAGNRDYEYRWRVAFEGREPEDWSRWNKETTRNLNVSVETPGILSTEVTGVGLDFENILDAVLVHLKYEDGSNDVPESGQSILLAPDRPSGTWRLPLYAPWEKPIDYRVEYLLKTGTSIEVGWEKTDGPTQNILIKPPEIDVLDVPLVPAGIWTDVIQSVVSLRYQDGDYHRDAQYNFKKSDEFKKWAVILLDPNKRAFEYRILSTFLNGDTQETEWLSRDGDQALGLKVVGPPRLEVRVTGAVLDFASTPLAKVDLEYDDPEGERDVESVSLQKPDDVKIWSIPIREGGPKRYRYQTTYFPVEGDPVEREWETTEDELIVVHRYSIPKVGAKFMPIRQDFTATPAVEVNLSYDDAQRDVHERMTLVFTDGTVQEWFVPVADDAPLGYVMTVTWYMADGATVTSSPVTLDKPAVVIPPAPRQS
ncbi:hypothetical protein [Thiocapsa bogorovii]|uniref:hypothetical protein n=1 Tax=Thiocapsa bogorovii TaxID=521689 RepID=UPI001E55B4EC|nr:hypothetical protein [Thiocapsa bogorovii]UHD15080.1 hypothetical protein LT988_17575 [Thiocapsa bogorovii]